MTPRQKIELPANYAYEGLFIKQLNPTKIAYDAVYVNKPRTTVEMAYLRLGWLSQHLTYAKLKQAKVVDIGSGAGVMTTSLKQICANVKNYDLAGPSITKKELRDNFWDVVVLNDVLEHYDNIDELFELKWRYAFLSFPETPNVATFEELTHWRHFRPNEHIYHLYEDGVRIWAAQMGADTVAAGDFEDILRTRWHPDFRNITTMLLCRRNF